MKGIRLRLELVVLALLMVPIPLGGELPGAWADGPLPRVNTVALGTAAHDIVLDGDFAYVATDVGLTILDISKSQEFPVVLGSAPIAGSGKSMGYRPGRVPPATPPI
jgi:hypothetical protein